MSNSQEPLFGRMGEWALYKDGEISPKAKVDGVSFLLPARVSYNIDEKIGGSTVVFVDMVQRKIYGNSDEVQEDFSKKIFDFLDNKTSMPEDVYEAGEDVYETAHEAQLRHDELYGTDLAGEQ